MLSIHQSTTGYAFSFFLLFQDLYLTYAAYFSPAKMPFFFFCDPIGRIWRMELIRDLFGEALLLLALLALKVYGPPTEEETSETYLDLAIITAPIKELDFLQRE